MDPLVLLTCTHTYTHTQTDDLHILFQASSRCAYSQSHTLVLSVWNPASSVHFTAHPCTRIMFLKSWSKASRAKLMPSYGGLLSAQSLDPFFFSANLPVCIHLSQKGVNTQTSVCFYHPQLTDLPFTECMLQSASACLPFSTPYLWPIHCSHMFFIKPLYQTTISLKAVILL